MPKIFSLDKKFIKILLLEGIHPSSVESFKAAGYTQVDYLKTALDEDDPEQRLRDVHIPGIRSRTRLSREVLRKAKKLIAAGCFSIGTNQADLMSAKQISIVHFNWGNGL